MHHYGSSARDWGTSKLWDQLSRHVEDRNSVFQNLNDLRDAVQEELNHMPKVDKKSTCEQDELGT